MRRSSGRRYTANVELQQLVSSATEVTVKTWIKLATKKDKKSFWAERFQS